MFERLRNGWRLAGESFAVLKADKKLLVFPFLSCIACLLVMLSFAGVILGTGLLDRLGNKEDTSTKVLGFVLVFSFYLVNYFIIIFFNAALVACALVRFNGGEPTLGDGIRASMSRLPQILGWAVVSATVGMILKVIENSSEKFGKFVAGLLGMAWNALTFFVVPVLVVERVGPIEAVKRSTAMVKKTWGESLVGNFSIALVIFLWCLVAAIPLFIGIAMSGTGGMTPLFIGLGVTLALWVVIGLVSAAAHVIITAILYQYAGEKAVPKGFDPDLLERAFVRKP
jgi:hypothetical protein